MILYRNMGNDVGIVTEMFYYHTNKNLLVSRVDIT